MNLVYDNPYFDIEFEENLINIITIENQNTFRKISADIFSQSCGNFGGFKLSELDKALSFNKYIDVIWNPFSVSCRDKKILTGVYNELVSQSGLAYLIEREELINAYNKYLELITRMSSFALGYTPDIDIKMLFKLADVHIIEEVDDAELVDRLINYLKAMHKICGIELFIFLGLKNYFTDEDIAEFYKSCLYEKIHVLSIESTYRKSLQCEKMMIIDKDDCIIEV